MIVLIPTTDHSYIEAVVIKTKVVYNKKYREYYEYHGDEYLGEDEQVLEMDVAE